MLSPASSELAESDVGALRGRPDPGGEPGQHAAADRQRGTDAEPHRRATSTARPDVRAGSRGGPTTPRCASPRPGPRRRSRRSPPRSGRRGRGRRRRPRSSRRGARSRARCPASPGARCPPPARRGRRRFPWRRARGARSRPSSASAASSARPGRRAGAAAAPARRGSGTRSRRGRARARPGRRGRRARRRGAAARRSGARCGSVSGSSSSSQPSGLSQRSHDERRVGVGGHPHEVRAARTAAPSDVRVVPGRAELSRDEPDRHEHRRRVHDRGREEERASRRRCRHRASLPTRPAMTAVGTHSATSPTPSPVAACASARPRVVCPASRSSQRPSSSSPRVTFVAIRSPQIAAITTSVNITLYCV